MAMLPSLSHGHGMPIMPAIASTIASAIAWPWHAYYACHRIYYRMATLPSLLHGHGMPIMPAMASAIAAIASAIASAIAWPCCHRYCMAMVCLLD